MKKPKKREISWKPRPAFYRVAAAEQVPAFLCAGCGHVIADGKQLEIETACRSTMCTHLEPETCAKAIVYSHATEVCFDAASERVSKRR